jgi:hypothetical protein
MTDKPAPHPPRQAKHPGRGKVAPHQRNTFQQEQHAKAMKRRAEPLMIARHCLKPHPHPKGHKP